MKTFLHHLNNLKGKLFYQCFHSLLCGIMLLANKDNQQVQKDDT